MSPAMKAHAVCLPWPEQGHIKPMMTMAKLLHLRGFHITFVHTLSNYNKILSAAGPVLPAGTPDGFRFETVDVDQVPAGLDARKRFSDAFRELVVNRLNSVAGGSTSPPPVTAIICDSFTTFAFDTAEELRVAKVQYTSVGACALMAYIQLDTLEKRGLLPLKSEDDLTNGYLDTVVDGIPGMKDIMRLRDFPTYVRTTVPNHGAIQFITNEMKGALRASAVVINTFDEFEAPVLDALSRILPPLYAVGPLQLLSRNHPNPELDSVGSSFWHEDSSCLEWLEGRAAGSVLYVNFGSTTFVTGEQMVELAWGLADSGVDILWVIREDLVKGEKAVLPEEFEAVTKGRSLLASWCPQEEVLMHRAVGGFLTHCGWNSMLESIMAGVPMICWPFFADHHPYCRYACTEWGIGIEFGEEAKRERVEEAVREVMEREKGKEMKKTAMKVKELAAKAVLPGGSSFHNFEKVIKQVLLATSSG